MQLPHRRISQRHTLDQNVLAAMRLNEVRPQVSTVAKYSLIHRRTVRDHFHQLRARGAGAAGALLPTTRLPPRPRPPVFATGLPIKHALAGNRDILLLKGIDERRIIHQLHAFPTSKDHRQILLRIRIEFDGRVFCDVQVDVAL